MHAPSPVRLRVLVADGQLARLELVLQTVRELGHDGIPEIELANVASATKAQRADVAMVIVGERSKHALELIDTIVHEATCPVIAVLDVQDRDFVREAAERGIFAFMTVGDDLQELQSSIDVALRRFAEYRDLEAAFVRRAVTERAKGVLMERHGLGEREAFQLLRDQARSTNRKIVDVAEAILTSRTLLPASLPVVPAGKPERMP